MRKAHGYELNLMSDLTETPNLSEETCAIELLSMVLESSRMKIRGNNNNLNVNDSSVLFEKDNMVAKYENEFLTSKTKEI